MTIHSLKECIAGKLLPWTPNPWTILALMHPTPKRPEPLPPYPAWMHEHNGIHGKLPRPDNYSSDNYNEWEDTQ